MKNNKKIFMGIIVILIIIAVIFNGYEMILNKRFDDAAEFRKSQSIYSSSKVAVKDIDSSYIMSKKEDMYYVIPLEKHFKISGFPYIDENETSFYRLREANSSTYPNEIKKRVSSTAGGRIRFKTNSNVVEIKITLDEIESYPHFALTGSAGVDIYLGTGQSKKWYATLAPANKLDKSYSGTMLLQGDNEHEVTINLPLYSSIKRIEVGLHSDSILYYPEPYTYEDPIIFYGSSITQGCSASRPGTSYPDLVTRWLDANLVNLGFSSSAKGELTIAASIAEMDMTAFIMEYDHNADTVEELRNTHYNFYSTIRKKKPELPIIFLSRCSEGYSIPSEEAKARRTVIEETYNRALSEGDTHVYYINGSDIIIDAIRDDCLVDGKHPNDRGMYLIANAVYLLLNDILLN